MSLGNNFADFVTEEVWIILQQSWFTCSKSILRLAIYGQLSLAYLFNRGWSTSFPKRLDISPNDSTYNPPDNTYQRKISVNLGFDRL